MAHPGIKGGGLRSLRTIAIDKGTNPRGFDGALGYDAVGGHPVNAQLPEQHYVEAPEHVDTGGPKPIENGAPFKVKGA